MKHPLLYLRQYENCMDTFTLMNYKHRWSTNTGSGVGNFYNMIQIPHKYHISIKKKSAFISTYLNIPLCISCFSNITRSQQSQKVNYFLTLQFHCSIQMFYTGWTIFIGIMSSFLKILLLKHNTSQQLWNILAVKGKVIKGYWQQYSKYGLDDQGIRYIFLAGTRDVSLLQITHMDFGSHPAS